MNSLQESIQQNLKLHIHSHIVFTISNEFLDVKILEVHIPVQKFHYYITRIYFNNQVGY